MMNEVEVVPIGYTVLIEPEPVKDKIGSIFVVTANGQKFEQQAQVKGKVLAVGPDAWNDYSVKDVQVGDVVYYQRHAGMRLPDDMGNVRQDRLLLKDTDIVARLPRG
jgi:co-chaperonin GroES (HSP10)